MTYIPRNVSFKTVSFIIVAFVVLGFAVATAYEASIAKTSTDTDSVAVARFDDGGDLIRPQKIDKWVFLGASLGMGYTPANFDPKSPGNFQTVLMEPLAYAAFEKTGVFPDGSMFALVVNSSKTNMSVNTSGFVMGEERALEIHLKDKNRFPKTGFNFYFFSPTAATAKTRKAPNVCTDCHMKHAAYDNVFTQFYPTLRGKVPTQPAE